jgi:CBS domain-containing protein
MHTNRLKAVDICNSPITLEPFNTLHDCRDIMFNKKISRIVIVKKRKAPYDVTPLIINIKPVGIITEKDISGFLFSHRPTCNIREIKINEVMSKALVTVTIEKEIKFCASMMLNSGISSLVVNDANGNLKGIFTKSDLVRAYSSYYAGKDVVKNHMTKSVHVIKADDALHVILSVMVENNISRVVVVKDRQPIGIITTCDLVRISNIADPYFDRYSRLQEQQAEGRNEGGEAREDSQKPEGATQINQQQKLSPPVLQATCGFKSIFLASDLMKYDPITITADSDLTKAAEIMTHRISGLPVIDDESSNNLVGIITKTDIVRAMSILS